MLKVIVLIVVVVAVGYGAFCCFAILNPQTGLPNMPDQGEAQFRVYINNTGNILYTDDYTQYGFEEGKRVFILHGYWELSGKDFKYRDRNSPPLDEAIFGEITIKRR